MKLPAKKKKPITDFARYTGLIYGREKIGKTLTLASFPETLFLSTEPGTKGLEIFEIQIKRWEDMLKAINLLENEPKRYRTIAIDTADNAYDMAMDYICRREGIPHPGESSSGKKDFGKSWKMVKQEFIKSVNRILNTRRGLWFTSHSRESEVSSHSGDRWDKIYPSMSGQARSVVEALVDFFFYAEYMRDIEGNTIRVLLTQGDETVWAGARKTVGGHFPPILPIVEEGGYEILSEAFHGRYEGIDPNSLRTARETSLPAAKVMKGMRDGEGKGKSRKGKSTKGTSKKGKAKQSKKGR